MLSGNLQLTYNSKRNRPFFSVNHPFLLERDGRLDEAFLGRSLNLDSRHGRSYLWLSSAKLRNVKTKKYSLKFQIKATRLSSLSLKWKPCLLSWTERTAFFVVCLWYR